MPRIIHFEIPADDAARAEKFYSDTFGWKFHKWDGPSPYWLITTGPNDQPGINGGMLNRPHPNYGPVNTLGVEDLDASIAAVTANGGQITVPKMAIPGIGWLAYAADTEGNPFGMMQNDPNAR